MTCIEQFIQTTDAAKQVLDSAVEACNGSLSCEEAAARAYAATVDAALTTYLNCRQGAGGGGGT